MRRGKTARMLNGVIKLERSIKWMIKNLFFPRYRKQSLLLCLSVRLVCTIYIGFTKTGG